MTVWALQDNIAFSFIHSILAGLSSHTDTHIYRTYCKHIFLSIHTYPHAHLLFFLNLFSDTHFSLFYTEEVRGCWRQRKPRRAEEGNSKDVCMRFRNSPSLLGLVLGSPAKHIKQFSPLLPSTLARRPVCPSHNYSPQQVHLQRMKPYEKI